LSQFANWEIINFKKLGFFSESCSIARRTNDIIHKAIGLQQEDLKKVLGDTSAGPPFGGVLGQIFEVMKKPDVSFEDVKNNVIK
jgi:hypothetical protein